MLKTALNDPSYVRDQYSASGNLEARIALHEKFSTAKQKWFDWYWAHFDLPIDARILEVGCGVGMLWRDNRARTPSASSWRITLSDFSLGMVETTRAANVRGDFLQSDAQSIPFPDSMFDAVIANHMLYHVPDLPRVLFEFRRVLKPGGKLFAATNGDYHLRELKSWVAEFVSAEYYPMLYENGVKQFSLENGAEQLQKFFKRVERFYFQDALIVTEVDPLMAYTISGFLGKMTTTEQIDALRKSATERIARNGAFRITKATGLFIATN